MPSVAYRIWRTSRAAFLNQIEMAHAAIGGAGPGRRYATQQINHAYVLLLAAEFQGFCRALHDESIAAILKSIPTTLSKVVATSLPLGRQLDRGNATPAAIGSDFGRFGFDVWPKLIAADPHLPVWQKKLSEMNEWRNAIAHSNFPSTPVPGAIALRLSIVRGYRKICGRLARALDNLLYSELHSLTGQPPW